MKSILQDLKRGVLFNFVNVIIRPALTLSLASLVFLGAGLVIEPARADGGSCAVALADSDYAPERLLEIAAEIETIMADRTRHREGEINALIKRHIFVTSDEIQSILHDRGNINVSNATNSKVGERAVLNLNHLITALTKAARITSKSSKVVQFWLTKTRGPVESRLAPVQKEIQYRHSDAIEDIKELEDESRMLEGLIKDVEDKRAFLLQDIALLRDLTKVMKADQQGRSVDPKAYEAADYVLLKASEILTNFNSIVGGALDAWKTRMVTNRVMISNVDEQMKTTIMHVRTQSLLPIDLTPRSKVQQLIDALEPLTKVERTKLVDQTELPPIKYFDMFSVLSLLHQPDQLQAFKRYKSNMKDQFENRKIDEILEIPAISNVNFAVLSQLLSESASGFKISDVFKLQKRFATTPEQLLAAVPTRIRLSQSKIESELTGIEHLSLNESYVFLDLLSAFEPDFEATETIGMNLTKKLSNDKEHVQLASRIERSIQARGLAIESELVQLKKQFGERPDALLAELELLVIRYRDKISPNQALKILQSIPTVSVLPTDASREKHFDEIKNDIRPYLAARSIPNTKDAFTSSDMVHMRMNMNVVVMFHTLRGMTKAVPQNIGSALKDEAFRIVNKSGLIDVPGNFNPDKPKLQSPLSRATSLRYLNEFFESCINKWTSSGTRVASPFSKLIVI